MHEPSEKARAATISKMQQKFVEFHKLFKNNLMALRQSDDISESANEDNICNDFQMCKIVTEEEETECKTTVNINTNRIDNKLFECIWSQCRYSCKTKTMLRKHNVCFIKSYLHMNSRIAVFMREPISTFGLK